MIKVNVNLKTFVIASSSKKNFELQLGRFGPTAFQTSRTESWYDFAPKKTL